MTQTARCMHPGEHISHSNVPELVCYLELGTLWSPPLPVCLIVLAYVQWLCMSSQAAHPL